jgi:hypothetical protein
MSPNLPQRRAFLEAKHPQQKANRQKATIKQPERNQKATISWPNIPQNIPQQFPQHIPQNMPATSRGRFFKGFCSWMATQLARRVVHQWATECIFDQTVGPYVISGDGFTLELPHPEEKKFMSPRAWWHVEQTPTAGVIG